MVSSLLFLEFQSMLLIFLSTCISLKSSVSWCWDCSAVVYSIHHCIHNCLHNFLRTWSLSDSFLSRKPSVGSDKLPHWFFRYAAAELTPVITRIVIAHWCAASSVLVTVPVNDAADVDSAAERNETAIRRRRRKRSVSVERNVETLVVVDPSMMDYYKNENIENYVLTIMNMVPPPHNTLAWVHAQLHIDTYFANTAMFIAVAADYDTQLINEVIQCVSNITIYL